MDCFFTVDGLQNGVLDLLGMDNRELILGWMQGRSSLAVILNQIDFSYGVYALASRQKL